MRALRVNRLADGLKGVALEESSVPAPGPCEALVRVHAAALGYPDLLMTRGAYQVKPELPFTLGMELAGEVIEAGPGCAFAVGDRVRGGAKTGAFADLAVVSDDGLSLIAPGMDFTAGAALGSAYLTAHVALVELGQLQPGQTVLVHGASGGVGLAACDLARALGAKVIAASHREEKLAALRTAARTDAAILNTGRFRDPVSDLTGGRLCDLVFDPIGGEVFDESTRCVAFGGKLLVVGFVSGRIPDIAANIPLIKGFSVVGVRAGEFARRFPERAARITAEIDQLASRGAITPRIDRLLPLSRWREGFEAMARGELLGKLVFQPG